MPVLTPPPSTVAGQGSRHPEKRWMITVNNYSPTTLATIDLLLACDTVQYAVRGKEVASTGTPHLQIFVVFTVNKRFNAVRALFPQSHIEIARSPSLNCSNYCKKESDFREFGTLPAAQGKRNDLNDAFTWADEFTSEHGYPPASPEIARHLPGIYTRYPRFTRCLERRSLGFDLQLGEPRDWQSSLAQRLEAPPDDRVIEFVLDPEGNKGKSWFQRWFMTNNKDKTQILGMGKRDDIAHMVDITKTIFLFNVPRDGMEFLQYTILEQLKDRMVSSPKYNSQMKIMRDKVHVVVFCNEHPDMNKMTRDRYLITEI